MSTGAYTSVIGAFVDLLTICAFDFVCLLCFCGSVLFMRGCGGCWKLVACWLCLMILVIYVNFALFDYFLFGFLRLVVVVVIAMCLRFDLVCLVSLLLDFDSLLDVFDCVLLVLCVCCFVVYLFCIALFGLLLAFLVGLCFIVAFLLAGCVWSFVVNCVWCFEISLF